MPEGDTIARAARSLDTWLKGRVVTKARSRTIKAPVERTFAETEGYDEIVLLRKSGGKSGDYLRECAERRAGS